MDWIFPNIHILTLLGVPSRQVDSYQLLYVNILLMVTRIKNDTKKENSKENTGDYMQPFCWISPSNKKSVMNLFLV